MGNKRTNTAFLAFAAAMGGFLFGYDTAVINGGEQQIQRLWSLSPALHGWVMSSAFFGTCLAAHLAWAVFVCPETKGKKLEEINL